MQSSGSLRGAKWLRDASRGEEMGCDVLWSTCSDVQAPASGATGHLLLLAIAHRQGQSRAQRGDSRREGQLCESRLFQAVGHT